MKRYCFLILFVISVICDDSCVTYDFEDGFEDFTYDYRVCVGLTEWTTGDYSSLQIDSPHAKSYTFISPGTTMSCVSSFQFEMNAQGSVEVNFYMDPASRGDQLSVLAFQSIDNNNDPTVGSSVITASSPSFVSGWQTLRFSVSGSVSFNGYLTFMGLASAESILIIDSFRFIPPSHSDEELCLIYEDDVVTTTEMTTVTTDTTVESITTETTTPFTTTEGENKTETSTATEITTTELTTMTPTQDHPESVETENESTVTESPSVDYYCFWNAFTISMVVVLVITTLALVFCIFYYIGRTKSSKEDKDIIIDESDLPEFKVPRINMENSNRFNGKFFV